MIKRLVIHRFRGIREGVLDDLGKVNLLVGPNNSGKTAILEMLYLGGNSVRPCEVMMERMDPSTRPSTTVAGYDFLGYGPLSRLQRRHGSSMHTTAKRRKGEESISFTLDLFSEKYPLGDLRIVPQHQLTPEEVEEIRMFTIYPLLKGKESHWSPTPGMIPSVFTKHRVRLENSRWHYLWDQSWVHRWKQKCDLDKIAVWAEEWEKPHQLTHIPYTLLFDFHTATEPFTNRFAKRSYLKVPGWKDKVSRSLSRIFPELKRAKINIIPSASGKEWIGYVEWPDLKPIEIDQFGDGARHAFKVLAGLVALCETVDDEHLGLFLWEDPELFMHPATLGRLLREVMGIVSAQPIQVFVTTQSLEVIAWFSHYFDELADEEVAKMRSYRLDLKNGGLQVQKFEGRGISGWLHFFGDPRFIGEDESASPLFILWGGQEL